MAGLLRVLTLGIALVLALAGTFASTATPASAAGPAAEAAPPPLPDSMAAIGDSITQAGDVCCFFGNWPSHSRSTGQAPLDGIASHYERIRARNPAIGGHRRNNAISGAQMADAPAQARRTARAPSTSPSSWGRQRPLRLGRHPHPTATFRA